MNIKRMSAGVALLCLFSAAQAQEVEPESVATEAAYQNNVSDSLQIQPAGTAVTEAVVSDVQERKKWSFTPLDGVWNRKKYWQIGLGWPTIKRVDGEDLTWKTQIAVSVKRGKTAYVHSKPFFGMMKVGIDYGFMDFTYAKLKLKTEEASTSSGGSYGGSNPDGFDDIVSPEPSGSIFSMLGVNLGMHKIDYGLFVGPSVSVNPWNHLIVSAYFHVKPTFSGIIENENFSYGVGCAFAAGVSVSYKAISIGLEGVWSSMKYHQISFDGDDDDDYDYEYDDEDSGFNLFNTKTFKLKQGGPRLYIAFRF